MNRKRMLVRVAMIVAVLIVGYLDYVTGYEFSFVLCYFAPIVIVAWYETLPVVLGVACLSGVVWYCSDALSGSVHSRVFYRYWEGVVKVVTFIIVGRAVYALRRARREKDALAQELAASQKNLRELAGLLPVCARCQGLCRDVQSAHRLRAFLDQHPELPPPLGCCPECAAQLPEAKSGSEIPLSPRVTSQARAATVPQTKLADRTTPD